jgi:glycosyltransferase involved in cell wall biosynthesis
VTPLKGHDLLVAALRSVADLPWRCTCVGSLDVDPEFARAVQDQVGAAGLADRLAFPGPLAEDDLERAYADADLLVLGSRIETWGIVAAEALARGIPVLGPDVGGLPEAIGAATDGTVPGLLVPPDDAAALGRGLRLWLTDVPLRQVWRTAAQERREWLPTWDDTVHEVTSVLQPQRDGACGRRTK